MGGTQLLALQHCVTALAGGKLHPGIASLGPVGGVVAVPPVHHTPLGWSPSARLGYVTSAVQQAWDAGTDGGAPQGVPTATGQFVWE